MATNQMFPVPQLLPDRFSTGLRIFDIFQETGLCKSKGEARRLQAQGGVYVNDKRIDDPDSCLGEANLQNGEILLRAGKKRYHRLILGILGGNHGQVHRNVQTQRKKP